MVEFPASSVSLPEGMIYRDYNDQVIQVVTKLYPQSLEVTRLNLWKGHVNLPSQQGHGLNHLGFGVFFIGGGCCLAAKLEMKQVTKAERIEIDVIGMI